MKCSGLNATSTKRILKTYRRLAVSITDRNPDDKGTEAKFKVGKPMEITQIAKKRAAYDQNSAMLVLALEVVASMLALATPSDIFGDVAGEYFRWQRRSCALAMCSGAQFTL